MLDSHTSVKNRTPVFKAPELSFANFHSSSEFEYQKFYNTAIGLASSVIKKGSVGITMIFRNTDEKGRDYFQYRLPSFLKNGEKSLDNQVVEFLEAYRIYPQKQDGEIDQETLDKFSIVKMYHHFSGLKVWQKPLVKTNLENYFKNETDGKITKDVVEDFSNPSSYNLRTVAEFQEAEKMMLQKVVIGFGEKTTIYLPIPLVARGRIMGAVYLVFDEAKLIDTDFSSEQAQRIFYRTFCLNLTREYERVALERRLNLNGPSAVDPLEGFQLVFFDIGIPYFWATKAEKEAHKQDLLNRNLKINPISSNDFLKSLGYHDYYHLYAPVYVAESLTVQKRKRETIKRAITAIIVDSFAHNVGAHSLVALKWWFEQRFKDYDKSLALETNGKPLHLIQYASLSNDLLSNTALSEQFFADLSGSEAAHTSNAVSFLDVIRFGSPEQLEQFFSFYDFDEWNNFNSRFVNKDEIKPITQFPIPTDSALHQYFEFLRNKSAFWSGVSRDLAFSGGVRTLRFLLQKFLNNTLFLGTVAHSEGINKVNVYLEFLKDEAEGEQKEEILISGQYAVIDLNIIRKNNTGTLSNTQSKEYIESEDQPESSGIKTRSGKKYSDFAFLREGKDYYELKEHVVAFDKTPLFFPGGIVGEQALFTLLENTLRNIKHYRRSLTKISENGINLYLSFKRVGFIERNEGEPTKDKKLVRIGTWLHHEQDLYVYGSEDKPVPVIQKQTEQLKQRIIDSNGGVRLGGSSQDKVCASFLLNGTFESIDAFHPYEAKKHYYPYVYSSSETFVESADRVAGMTPKETVFHITYNKDMRSPHLDRKERAIKYQMAIVRYTENFSPKSMPQGTIKKYFHLWIGENFRLVTNTYHSANELFGRNKVVAVDGFIPRTNANPMPFFEARKALRRSGLVRIINADDFLRHLENEKKKIDDPTTVFEIGNKQYRYSIAKWLGEWLKRDDDSNKEVAAMNRLDSNNIWVEFYHDGNQIVVAQLFRGSETDDWELIYHTPTDLLLSVGKIIIPKRFHRIELAHGQQTQDDLVGIKQYVKVRSHGSLFTDILNHTPVTDEKKANDAILSLNEVDAAKVKAAELLETVLTRIVIYDNRVFDRLPEAKKIIDINKTNFSKKVEFDNYQKTKTVMKDDLLLEAFPERGKFMQDDFFAYVLKNTHFLIIHLSYLETIWKFPNTPGETFGEDEVIEFFEMKIKDFYQERFGKELPPNFMLVITSGRGRADWIDRLVEESEKERNYFDQITFRPIESIVGAIEDGLVMNDDFQIKYNLCKVLYGS